MTDTPAPAGPDAPADHKLPSGITVTLRSHRTLRRPDIHRVWKSVTDPDLAGAQQHDELIRMLVTGCADPRYPVPWTAETLDLLDADDYLAAYQAVGDAYRLVTGQSVIPRPDDYADPTPPTPASSGTDPD